MNKKSKRGRPPKKAGTHQDIRRLVSFTADEFDQVKRAADGDAVSFSEWVRRAALRALKRRKRD